MSEYEVEIQFVKKSLHRREQPSKRPPVNCCAVFVNSMGTETSYQKCPQKQTKKDSKPVSNTTKSSLFFGWRVLDVFVIRFV